MQVVLNYDNYKNIIEQTVKFINEEVNSSNPYLYELLDSTPYIVESFLIDVISQQYSSNKSFPVELINRKSFRFAVNIIFNYDMCNYVYENERKYFLRINGHNKCLNRATYPDSLMYCLKKLECKPKCKLTRKLCEENVFKKFKKIFEDDKFEYNKFKAFILDTELYHELSELYHKFSEREDEGQEYISIKEDRVEEFFSWVHFEHIFKKNSIYKISKILEGKEFDKKYVSDIFRALENIFKLTKFIDYTSNGIAYDIFLNKLFNEHSDDIYNFINNVKEKTLEFYYSKIAEFVDEISKTEITIDETLIEYLLLFKEKNIDNFQYKEFKNSRIFNFLSWGILRTEFHEQRKLLNKFPYIDSEGKITVINEKVNSEYGKRYMVKDIVVTENSDVFHEYLQIHEEFKNIIDFIRVPFLIIDNGNLKMLEKVDIGFKNDEYEVLFPLFESDKKNRYYIQFKKPDKTSSLSYYRWIPEKIVSD